MSTTNLGPLLPGRRYYLAVQNTTNVAANFAIEVDFDITPLVNHVPQTNALGLAFQKYYFYDLGIRNSLINNFNPIALRTDQGGLWENFCILERMKMHAAKGTRLSMYFWRTYEQKEIDLVEEYDGKLHAIEFKWNPKEKVKLPQIFMENYKPKSTQTINKENFMEFLTVYPY